MAQQQENMARQGASILEDVNTMAYNIDNMKEMCGKIRRFLDEGTYKIDSLLNIISGVKAREHEIMAAGGDQTFLHQMNEQQIDSFLEMLKSPPFQKIARQMIVKFINSSDKGKETG
jgi:hypothetical protein